jgi:excisionase family DNA binding protein
MLDKFPDILTFDQFCEALQIGRSLAYSLLHNGQIQFKMIGRAYRIPKRYILQYLGI